MKNIHKLLAITGIVAVLAITNVASIAFANTGEESNNSDASKMQQRRQMQVDPERIEEMKQHREEVKAAIESGDYDTWYALMTEDDRTPQILEKVNADNFDLFVEMHQKIQDGDIDGAKEIADELGIKRPLEKRGRVGQNVDPERIEEMKQHREEVKAAIESGDYDTWYALMTENDRTPQILEKVNADNFDLFVEMHQKIQDGDIDRAKEIADELGIEKPLFKRKGRCPQAQL